MTTTEWQYQISDRIGDRIVVGRANTADELYVVSAVLGEYIDNVKGKPGVQAVTPPQAEQNVRQVFPQATQVQAPAWPASQAELAAASVAPLPAFDQTTYNGATTPPAPAGPPSCSHGVMKYAEGTNKQGSPYKGYYCQLKTDNWKERCQPIKL